MQHGVACDSNLVININYMPSCIQQFTLFIQFSHACNNYVLFHKVLPSLVVVCIIRIQTGTSSKIHVSMLMSCSYWTLSMVCLCVLFITKYPMQCMVAS